tara:strand:+ start:122 stop:670 length:549 start_codon:yes stop_codon:yes gene_type:complete
VVSFVVLGLIVGDVSSIIDAKDRSVLIKACEPSSGVLKKRDSVFSIVHLDDSCIGVHIKNNFTTVHGNSLPLICVLEELLHGDLVSLREKLCTTRTNEETPLNRIAIKEVRVERLKDLFTLVVVSKVDNDVAVVAVLDWPTAACALNIGIVELHPVPKNWALNHDCKVFHLFSGKVGALSTP